MGIQKKAYRMYDMHCILNIIPQDYTIVVFMFRI